MSKPDFLISLDDDAEEKNLKPYTREYCGRRDLSGLRTGRGCQSCVRDHYEKYEGNFLLNNIHGKGVYIIQVGSKRTICSGSFYCNDVDGYAEIIYCNGTFEGLFRQNRKFGPGVLTYIDGSQDVGLWFDHTLIRLSCVVLPNWVPFLGRTAAGKTYLLQFRKLIPVKSEATVDKATEILMELGATEDVLKNAHKLYNPYIRNRNSLFFNKSLYDETFFEAKDCYIDVAIIESEESSDETTENEQSYCDCNCEDFVGVRRQELLKEISAVDHKLYDLLERLKESNELGQSESIMELLSTTDTAHTASVIESYKARANALMNFREILKSRMAETKQGIPKSVSTTKVLVTDLLAWNNEKMFINMLKHCFLHKTTENSMSFDVSKLLAGERKEFEKAGKHERNCIEFLTKCSEGKVYEISDLLRKHNLNPDLCDAHGNTGLIFAVARDKVLVIKALAKSGANLDAVNDEGLTPLNVCMARYLAVKYRINDWERAFLPEIDRAEETDHEYSFDADSQRVLSLAMEESMRYTEPSEFNLSVTDITYRTKTLLSKEFFAHGNTDDAELQAQGTSLLDLTRLLKLYSTSPRMQEFQLPYSHHVDREQNYIFNTACVRLMEKPTLKQICEANITSPKTIEEDEKNEEAATAEKCLLTDRLDVVRRTMLCLLHFGSDPDAGQVPFPALVMAVFTQSVDIVEHLLENNADPNITTLGENMTPLHTVVSLQPSKQLIEVGQVLLRYKANPNCRASPTHWLLLNASVLGHGFENELPDIGKTPLHLLCMRYDFLSDQSNYYENLAKLLLQNGANGNDMFLGHSPLSLAVVRGNIRLVETLLNMGKVDPNQKLGRGMGVPLTVLILKRYADVLYFDVCKVILDTLLEGRANPFEPIFAYGNAIDFMQRKHEARLTAEREQAEKKIQAEVVEEEKQKKSKKKKRKKEKVQEEEEERTDKGKKKGKPTDQVLMQKYLLERSREVLLKRIQCQATKILYDIMDEYVPVDDIIGVFQLLSPQDVCNSIELLLREGELTYKCLHFETLYRLVQYVADVTKKRSASEQTKRKRSSNITEEIPPTESYKSAQEILKLLGGMDITEKPKFQGAVHPSTDHDADKYKVCFHCCRKKGRELYNCPNCEMVYFCSELCNKLSNKSKSKHACRLVFYKNQKAKYEQIKKGTLEPTISKISEKLDIVNTKRTERDILKREEELKAKRLKKWKMLNLEKPKTPIMNQNRLEQYVEIMMKHIKKLETAEQDDDEVTLVSLTQLAKDICEIALNQENLISTTYLHTDSSRVRSYSKRFSTTLDLKPRDTPDKTLDRRDSTVASKVDHTILTKESKVSLRDVREQRGKFSVNRFECVSSTRQPSKQLSESHLMKHDTRNTIPSKTRTRDNVKVIYERGTLKTTTTQDSVIKPQASGRFTIEKKKAPVKPQESSKAIGSLKVLYENKKSRQKSGKSEAISFKINKTKMTVMVKHETKGTKKLYASSIKHEARIKTSLRTHKGTTRSHSKKSVRANENLKTCGEKACMEPCDSIEIPVEEVVEEEKKKKDEKVTSDKKGGRFAQYWFHQSFIKKLSKLFPTLDFPKLLLPFACFAEGQLYYRFDKNGSFYCTNYSKL